MIQIVDDIDLDRVQHELTQLVEVQSAFAQMLGILIQQRRNLEAALLKACDGDQHKAASLYAGAAGQ